MALGRVDMVGFLECLRVKDYIKSLFRLMEYDSAQYLGKSSVKQMLKRSIIFDLKYLSMNHITNKKGKNCINYSFRIS